MWGKSVIPSSVLLLLFCGRHYEVNAQGDALVQPPIIESSNGLLDITLTLEYTTISGPFFTLTNTRLFNGILPGPTLRLDAGDNVRIFFDNQLESQPNTVFGNNEFSKPDYSNLHFHGGHVSGELPSDDVRLLVSPGSSYQYDTTFPDNHMPGTHWIHPHVHGSSALQTAGGAGLTLIVNDPAGYLPSQVENAKEVILFVHHMELTTLEELIGLHNDQKMSISVDNGGSNDFRLVNGQYQPEASMQPGEWQRFRIVMAGWLIEELDFQIDSNQCEMYLLSKDGIYISNFPRAISVVPIPAGGRSDVMVRCNSAGTYNVLDYSGETLMTLVVSGNTVSSTALESWTPTYPAYLTDLQNTPADDGCSCVTAFDFCTASNRELQDHKNHGIANDLFCVNDMLFEPDVYLHKIKYGAVVERDIRDSLKHPYHQHVYPFQLIATGNINENSHSDYYQVGDWQDVLQIDARDVFVRYRADVHVGLIMMHCHILTHEDRGTMAQELVVEDEDCSCTPFTIAPSAPVFSPTAPVVVPTTPVFSPTAPVVVPTTPVFSPVDQPVFQPVFSPVEEPSSAPIGGLVELNIANANFESDNNKWKIISGDPVRECYTGNERAGDCAFAFYADDGASQKIKNRLRKVPSGDAGDQFYLYYWVKGVDVKQKRDFRAIVKPVGYDGSTEKFICKLTEKKTFGYMQMMCPFQPSFDYEYITLMFEFIGSRGAIYLDWLDLYKNP